MDQRFDVIIIGAGGAGLMCAIHAGKRGRKVAVLDHAQKVGGKILISGGGRCNFTNTGAGPSNYVSENPHFCKSALSRYPAENFIEMVKAHRIPFHEKKLGQLFCDHSAQDVVKMLQTECDQVGARILLNCRVNEIVKAPNETAEGESCRYRLQTSQGSLGCHSLVVATGGLSIPKIGATGFGYEIARKFGLSLIETAPALDGFTFSGDLLALAKELAGLSVDVVLSVRGKSFRENILFTHSGLSGPAALQVSLHWRPGDEISFNLLPGLNAFDWLMEKKREGSRTLVKNLLSEHFPARFAEKFCEIHQVPALPLAQIKDKDLEVFCQKIHDWRVRPSGTVGYSKAEVTRGGVDTAELSSRTMEAKKSPGLYFIGEVVDVTGWLGGYNFQWAWASGWAAGEVV